MTPCEKLGYKVGDKFEIIAEHFAFKKGDVVILVHDDRSECPRFKSEGGGDYWFVLIEKLKPIKQGENSLLATRHDIIDALRETGASLSLHDAMEIAETLLDKFNIEK